MTNPFQDGPASNEKFMFGTLSLRVNKIVLQAGHEGYTEPDLTNKDGDLYYFKAKVKDPGGYYNHAIMVLKCRRQNGTEYLAHRDFLYKDDDPEMEMAMPALRQFFGQNLEKICGRTAEVKVQDARFEVGGYKKSTFVVVEVYPDRAAREAAEQKHFAQFSSPEPQSGAEIADDIPGFGEDPIPFGEPEPTPVGMPLDQAVNLLQPLWLSSGQNANQFYSQLAGMPVITPHFGETVERVAQAPEVMITVIGEMSCDQAINFLPSLWLSSGQDADTLYKVLACMPALIPHFGRTPEEFILIPEIAVLVGGQALQPEECI